MTGRRLWVAAFAGVIIAAGGGSVAAGAAPAVGVPMESRSTTAKVIRVVDGDTIKTTKGTVRLIGIDTPEKGRCNAAKATKNARRLAPAGSTVRLTLPDGENNQDRYGRLIRYVSRKGVDVGGAQIKAGLADARYDSRDGYPWHPKESKYRRWDAKYRDKKCGGTSEGTSGGSDTYTGCRAYGPTGTSVDSQGRRFTKIDCKTKQPL